MRLLHRHCERSEAIHLSTKSAWIASSLTLLAMTVWGSYLVNSRMPLSVLALWTVLAAVAAWGSFYFARHDPKSTSLMKMIFAGFLLAAFGAVSVLLKWLPEGMIGEGLFAYAMLFIVWLMAAIGAPLCIGSMIGILTGLYAGRGRHDHAA